MFKNNQWTVTDYGLEAMITETAPYEIDAERLVNTTDGPDGIIYDWPVHMASKTWIDIDAFIEAFEHALQEHKGRYSPAVDLDMLAATFEEARRIVADRN